MAQLSPDVNPVQTPTKSAPLGYRDRHQPRPVVLFTIIADHGTLKIAAVAALVIAVGVCVYSMRTVDGRR